MRAHLDDLGGGAAPRGSVYPTAGDRAGGGVRVRSDLVAGLTAPPSAVGGIALTAREHQVLAGMSQGMTNNEIGALLFVSEDTVKSHAHRLFRKLGARDRAHAVAVGFRRGLVR